MAANSLAPISAVITDRNFARRKDQGIKLVAATTATIGSIVFPIMSYRLAAAYPALAVILAIGCMLGSGAKNIECMMREVPPAFKNPSVKKTLKNTPSMVVSCISAIPMTKIAEEVYYENDFPVAKFFIATTFITRAVLGKTGMEILGTSFFWWLKVVTDKVFREKEEIIFMLHRLSENCRKIPADTLQNFLHSLADKNPQQKKFAALEFAKLHGIDYRPLNFQSAETFYNFLGTAAGMYGNSIVYNGAVAAMQDYVGASGNTAIGLGLVSMLPNALLQGQSIRQLRHLDMPTTRDIFADPLIIFGFISGVLSAIPIIPIGLSIASLPVGVTAMLMCSVGIIAMNGRSTHSLSQRFFFKRKPESESHMTFKRELKAMTEEIRTTSNDAVQTLHDNARFGVNPTNMIEVQTMKAALVPTLAPAPAQ